MSVFYVRKPSRKGPEHDRWHVRQKDGGNGRVKVLEIHPSEADAARRVNEIKAAMETGRRVERVSRTLRTATLGAVADRFIADQEASGAVKPQTLRGYRRDRNRLGRLADLPARAITEEDVQRWANELRTARGLKPTTIRITIVRLAQFLDAAKVTPNPAKGIKRPKAVRLPKVLPRWAELMEVRANLEATAILSTAPSAQHMVALFDLLLGGGLRIEEACSLTWRNVDYRRRRLVAVLGKYDRLRNVDVLPFQDDWLPERPAGAADGDLVFGGVTPWVALRALKAASSDDGLPHVHPHLLRHWHGSWMVATIGDHRMAPAAIAARMGHSVSMLFDSYTHEIVPDDAPEAVLSSASR